VQFVAARIVVDLFLKMDRSHRLGQYGRVEDDLLLGKCMLIDGIARRTKDDDAFCTQFLCLIQVSINKFPGDLTTLLNRIAFEGLNGGPIEEIASAEFLREKSVGDPLCNQNLVEGLDHVR
jgi:hypothetical protein